MNQRIYIGCSGFSNKEWKGILYPENARSSDYLKIYSEQFNCVEINSTFYRKPLIKTLDRWRTETQPEFRFFIKMPKIITHLSKLEDCKDIAFSFRHYISEHLDKKLAGFIFQLPPSFKFTTENLDLVLEMSDLNFKNVFEFRHSSWWNPIVFDQMKESRLIFSGVDIPRDVSNGFIINNSDYVYYRLHGNPVIYKSSYSKSFLENLAKEIKESKKTCFVFFNNTWGSAGVENALLLKQVLH